MMIAKLLLVLACIYVLLCLILYQIQERFIFYPLRLSDDYPFNEFRNVEEVYFPIDAQTRLHALHFHVDRPRGIILYFHGNARALDNWGYAAADFTQRGYNVFMPDYRGYGKSTGTLSEAALLSDAQIIYDSLRQQYPNQDLLLYGRSLGTGIACDLATKVDARLLLLETPYLSLLAMAQAQMPFFPANLLLRYPMRSDLKITQIKMPAYLFHGTQDELIPYAQAVELSRIYQPNRLFTIKGASHNNLSEFAAFQEKLDDLLGPRLR
ncbi:MAG: alpha/beta fold hydrolase [Bacteroidota bacterium]